jgi:hypothetical protein
MSFEARCPQCLFVTRQLGQPTPCLLHVALAPESASEPAAAATDACDVEVEDYDEPYAFGEQRLTVDRPGPLSLREYVRLQLLRTRLQAEPSPLDAPTPGAQAGSLSRR